MLFREDARWTTEGPANARSAAGQISRWVAIALGIAMTLAVRGYQFGESNHAVYLLDAMRRTDPSLLGNDWFTTQTLQYHALFGVITSWLMKLGMLEAGFAIGYAITVAALHGAWWRIVRNLGGDERAYLLSVVLYYLSAGGFGLGMYAFLQDSSFLPSNVANVALLWGIALAMERKWTWAGAALGVAGVFHLNHAVVGAGLWGWVLMYGCWQRRSMGEPPMRQEGTAPAVAWAARPCPSSWQKLAIGTAICWLLCGVNVLLALRVTAGKSGVLPLADFVQLYVKLRHPHHYDPASWHWGLWVSFLWPVPLAIAWWRQHGWDAMAWMMLAITGLIAVALVGAGIWYFHESLVQMSLYRFSIYPKLVACIGAAMLLMRRAEVTRFAVGIIVLVTLAGAMGLAGRMEIVAQNLPAIAGFCAIALLSLGWRVMSMPVAAVALAVLAIALEILLWDRLGIRVLHREPAGYWQVVEYAREHTPVDAVFLVPPEENVMRLHGQRAIVVNLKGVPQLSGEMVDWKNRMQAVLNVDDLSQFQTGLFTQTLSQMGNRYAELSEDVLTATARQFGARYIVARKPFAKRTPLIASADDGYFLYDLQSSGD